MATKRKDAVALLIQEHEVVRGLLAQLGRAAARDGRTSDALRRRLESELSRHLKLEDEIFFPAFRAAVSRRTDIRRYHEAKAEDHILDLVLPEILEVSVGREEFVAKVRVLRRLVEHHLLDEERELFRRAREVMGADELERLGDEIAFRKRDLRGESVAGD